MSRLDEIEGHFALGGVGVLYHEDIAYLVRVARAAERLQKAADAMQDHHCSGTCGVYPQDHDDVMREHNDADAAMRRALEGTPEEETP